MRRRRAVQITRFGKSDVLDVVDPHSPPGLGVQLHPVLAADVLVTAASRNAGHVSH